MKTLPPAARRFIVAVYLAGIAALVVAWLLPPPLDASRNVWEFASLILVSGVFGSQSLQLLPRRGSQENAGLSLGFVFTFWAMLRFGPVGAATVGGAAACGAGLLARQAWYQVLFNVATLCVQGIASSCVYLALNDYALAVRLPQSLSALIASCLVHYLVNTGAVALVVGLASSQRFTVVWKDNFLWLAPSYLIGAALSVLAAVLWAEQIPWLVIAVLPFAFLLYKGTRANRDRVTELAESQEKLANMYQAITRSLALALDAKDHYTHQHILRVQAYAMAISREMGLNGSDLEAIETGALLHDVGKVGISEAILLKPGRLTAEEFTEIKRHPVIGAEILEPVAFPYPVIPIVKHHHERWDGTGYPDGLAGENIPLSARILAVADVYDALTTTRAYRSAWSHEEACNEVQSQSGKHFDPKVVTAFVNVIGTVIVERPFAPPLNPAPLVDERLLQKIEVSTEEPILFGAK